VGGVTGGAVELGGGWRRCAAGHRLVDVLVEVGMNF